MDKETAHKLLTEMDLPRTHYQTERLPKREQIFYLDQHFDRFWYTAQLAKKYLEGIEKPNVMEIGGFPFYLLSLVAVENNAHVLSVDIPPASYESTKKTGSSKQKFAVQLGKETVEVDQLLANVERDTLTIENQMDLVIFTEVLEHLTLSPHIVVENIHRALKPGGVVILTTPNAHYLMKILSLLSGKNLYEPYQLRWGIYGRHNREYLLWEVEELLKQNHFEILSAHRKNFAKHHLQGSSRMKYSTVDTVSSLPFMSNYREVLVVAARKYGETVRVAPDFLFRN